MKNYLKISVVACLLFGLCASVCAQNINGSWIWISEPDAQKLRIAFWVDIKRRGNKLSGNLWFNVVTEEENNDPSFIPFVGRMKGKTAIIEFDEADLRPIWEENMRYKRAKSPSVATLRFIKGKLRWTQVKGFQDTGDGVPRTVLLERSK